MRGFESPTGRPYRSQNPHSCFTQNVNCSFAKIGSFVDSDVPIHIPIATVATCWPLRDILHEASQEMMGQSDGPLGQIASKVVAAELCEGDSMNPNAIRTAGLPRPPRLMVFFYDEWADATANLSKGDILEFVTPYSPVDTRPDDHEHCLVFATHRLLSCSNLMKGQSLLEQETIISWLRLTLMRRNISTALPSNQMVEVMKLTEKGVLNFQTLPSSPRSRKASRGRDMAAAALSLSPPSTSMSVNATQPQQSSSLSQQYQFQVPQPPAPTNQLKKKENIYHYFTLAQLRNEALKRVRKKFECWGIVQRSAAVQPTRTGELFLTIEIVDKGFLDHQPEPGQEREFAVAMIFAAKEHGPQLANLVLCPGDLIRLHRFSVNMWEGRLQLTGNFKSSAVYAMHPLNPPRKVPGVSAVTSTTSPQLPGENGDQPFRVTSVGRNILENTILSAAPPRKKVKFQTNESIPCHDLIKQGNVEVSIEKMLVIENDLKKVIALPKIPCYSAHASTELLKHAQYSILRVKEDTDPLDKDEWVVTMSSLSATVPLIGANYESIADKITVRSLCWIAFSFMASKQFVPKLGLESETSKWIRISDLPQLIQSENEVLNNIGTKKGDFGSLIDLRIKQDIVCLVVNVIIEYDSDKHPLSQDIKSVKLRCWDGSGVSPSREAMNFREWMGSKPSSPSTSSAFSEQRVEQAAKAITSGFLFVDLASGKFKSIMEKDGINPEVGDDEGVASTSFRQPTQLLTIASSAFYKLAKNKALDKERREEGQDPSSDPIGDPVELKLLERLAETHQQYANALVGNNSTSSQDTGVIHGRMIEVELDVQSLTENAFECFTRGVSCRDSKALEGLIGNWIRLSKVIYTPPSLNNQNLSFAEEVVLKFDSLSNCEVLPFYAAQPRILLSEHLASLSQLSLHVRYGVNRLERAQRSPVQSKPFSSAPQHSGKCQPRQNKVSRLQFQLLGSESFCLAEVLACPFPDTITTVAEIKRYYPNNFSTDFDFDLGQKLNDNEWRWVIALTLSDDSADLTCMLSDDFALKLLGPCRAALSERSSHKKINTMMEKEGYPTIAANKAREMLTNTLGRYFKVTFEIDFVHLKTDNSNDAISTLRPYIADMELVG